MYTHTGTWRGLPRFTYFYFNQPSLTTAQHLLSQNHRICHCPPTGMTGTLQLTFCSLSISIHSSTCHYRQLTS